jgi:hypothetical protein
MLLFPHISHISHNLAFSTDIRGYLVSPHALYLLGAFFQANLSSAAVRWDIPSQAISVWSHVGLIV